MSMWWQPASTQASTTGSPKNLYGPTQLSKTFACDAIESKDEESDESHIMIGMREKSLSTLAPARAKAAFKRPSFLPVENK